MTKRDKLEEPNRQTGRIGRRKWVVLALGAPTIAFLAMGPTSARATERKFTYVYEATTMPKGHAEYEQWVTWKRAPEDNRSFDQFAFRHELEFGITDKLQAAWYVSDWEYEEDAQNDTNQGDWKDTAFELQYKLTDPTADPLGMAIYGEAKIGDELFELEGKFIAQKNLGPWVLAYNATIEAEWEGHDYVEDNGALEQAAGVSYQFTPNVSAGVELLHEIHMPDWAGARGKGVLYLGPNVSYRAERWWATLTPLMQVSDVEDEPDFQMRLLVGINLTR